jgi:two-component system, OmpR family, sensor histidine kinase SenX3
MRSWSARSRTRASWRRSVRFGSSVRLGQIVTNLLSNAFKYSPEGAPVIVKLTKLGDFAVVSVQDRGEGIAMDDQDRVFERFYRAETGLTQTAGGFGLGLFIARSLAEAMGGGLVLSSRPGEGSTFSVSLPLLMAAPQADDPEDQGHSSPDTDASRYQPAADEPMAHVLTNTDLATR